MEKHRTPLSEVWHWATTVNLLSFTVEPELLGHKFWWKYKIRGMRIREDKLKTPLFSDDTIWLSILKTLKNSKKYNTNNLKMSKIAEY